MTAKRSGVRQVSSLMLLAVIYIQLDCLDEVSSEQKPQRTVSRVAPTIQNQTNLTGTRTVSKQQNSSTEPTPGDLLLVSRGIFVREKASRVVSKVSQNTNDYPISEQRNQAGNYQAKVLFTSGIFDDDPVRSAATPDDVDLLQTITNQTNGQNQPSNSPEQADSNYQNAGQLAGSSASELNQSFLSLFDELWLIKNASATTLIRLNYFGNLSRNQISAPNGSNDATSLTGRFSNRWARPLGRPHTYLNQNKQTMASSKEQVADRLSQAGLTIRGWLATAQQRLAEVKDKLVMPFRWAPTQAADNNSRSSTRANSNLLRLKPKPLDGQVSRPKRGIDTRFLGDFDVIWQQQQQTSPCNKLTIDQENQCRSMERLVNSHLDDKFPGTMQAIEDNCRLINHLLTDCWIQQSIQLRMSLSSRNESLQKFITQPGGKKIGEPFRGLVNSCGVEPNSPQYIRDRVSWMWLNLCLDRRFRRGYTSNVYCLSVWTIPKAQQICSLEYNRMQNYYSMSQSNGGQAVNLGINYTHLTGVTKSEPSALVAKSFGESGDVAYDNGQPPVNQRANQTVLAEAAATSAAGVSSSQLVAETTRGLSEAELVDREVSSKMLCCMFDQFLRCIYKQAVWECGKRGAQFVVDFMSRIGTDDMKYLCNADSKAPNPPETSSMPLLLPGPNYPNVRPTAWAGPLPISIPNDDNYRAPGGGQTNGNGNLSNSSNRNPFLDNDYCVDSRIQNALASFNAASDMNEQQTSSITPASPKLNPNRMRTPSYDPAYSDPRDTSASGAKCHVDHKMMALVSFGSWLLIQVHASKFEDAQH